jgi:hypothetical protein
MATAKKLDIFSLRDKFELPLERINEEAQASAIRRAEVMGWSEVEVRASDKPVISEGEFKCYSFEIWGIESESATSDNSKSEKAGTSQEPRTAAREADL